MAEAFRAALARAAEDSQALLRERLAAHDLPVARAMEHAVTGGKGLRGFLVLEGAALHGVDRAAALRPAAGIEALHAYSLVHDDLPAMDDDELRRGRPTVHVAWDEATAILAGDALQSLAFELCADPGVGPHRADLCLSLARASGIAGMVGGQARDIMAESAAEPLDLERITELQQGKTGALIRWSAEAGPVMAGADPSAMGRYATALGLAFQIADDILDVEGDAAKMGKAVRKDAGAGKATFVSLLGLDAARARAAELVEAACDALAPYGEGAATLRDAARFVIARES
ncbi:polyprenyl synthetase family protein [Limimaricola pyoseonensis]|uniref:Geranylgeranyl diphosphate synthase n=1 Tax=Limimaricola pyoseonensis TaxID=521013 RepID=A0A1G7EVP9_9RHOB|nr:polyprenyl synthetase family protein [Limimaricola pyoseonensis]SDE67774.1 farnesyl diphosphate synthase [Limimaricola pyoseonensis]